jgi:predicted lipoprotein
MRGLLILAALLGMVAPATAQTLPRPREAEAVLQAAVTEVIRPGMQGFGAASKEMVNALETLCVTPTPEALASSRQSFAAVVAAYGRIDFLRLGPLLEENRADRLLFWPDRRGIGLRQVQAILAEEDASATQLATLQDKSVAVQGLGALEFVLYGTGSDSLAAPAGAFRCAYGRTIAANIAQIAGELVADWNAPGGVAGHLMSPHPDYADYRTTVEAMEEMVGLVAHGAETLRDRHLKPFLAGPDKAASPKLAAFWRSELTLVFVRANIEGMHALAVSTGLTRAVEEKDKWLVNSVDFEFRNALRALDSVKLPLAEALDNQEQAAALDYLVLVTGALQTVVGEQLSAALGLSVGFSSLDGD